MSLLNRMGCVVTWVTRVSGLRGPKLHELRGSKFFLRESIFYVGHNFYVGWVGQNLFAWVNFFTWFKIFCVSQKFLRGLNFGVSLFFLWGGRGGGWSK